MADSAPNDSTPAAKKTAVKKTVAKKTVAKKAPAKTATSTRAPAKQAAAKRAPAKKAAATRAPAKKAAAPRAPAKKAAAARPAATRTTAASKPAAAPKPAANGAGDADQNLIQRLINWRVSAAMEPHPPNETVMKLQQPLVDLLEKYYFRVEVEGWEKVPDETCLVIGVHSGGALTMDAWSLVNAWQKHFAGRRFLHGTAHDVLMASPGLGDYFRAVEVLLPGVHQRPGVHREFPAGVDPDDQAGLVGHPLPAVDLDPEVVLLQRVHERLLQLHQRLVRRMRLHGGAHPPVDDALDDVLSLVVVHGVSLVAEGPSALQDQRPRSSGVTRSAPGCLLS